MKITFKIAAVWCLALFLFTGCSSPGKKQQLPPQIPQQQAAQPRSRINEYLKSGNWKGCLASFQQEAENNPKSIQAHCSVAGAAIKEHNLELAEKELLLASRLDPKSALPEAYLGWLYAEKKVYPKAEEHLKRAKELDSQLAVTYELTAYVEKLKGNYDAALTQIEEAQKKEYKSSRLLSTAEIYFAKGNKDQAKTDLNAVIRKNGNDYRALTSIGAVYISDKNYTMARKVLERSLKINPGLPATYLNLGVAYMKLNSIKAAIKTLEKAIILQPTNDKSHFYLGQACLLAKNKKRAEREFMQAVSLNPDNKRAAEALAGLKR